MGAVVGWVSSGRLNEFGISADKWNKAQVTAVTAESKVTEAATRVKEALNREEAALHEIDTITTGVWEKLVDGVFHEPGVNK